MSLSSLAVAVLVLLVEEPMHPYRMQQLIEDRGIDLVVNVRSRSGLYATIERLSRDGLVGIERLERADRRPERAVYRITENGTEALHQSLRDQLAARDGYPVFPAMISFVHILEPADVARQLSKRATALRTTVQTASAVLENSVQHGVPRIYLLEHELLHASATAELEFVQQTINDIEGRRLDWNPTFSDQPEKH